MQLIANTSDFYINHKTAVAIGKFDGVHVGHRKLLEEILKQKERGLLACVFTFDPPPAVFFGVSDGKVLTTKEEKRSIFAKLGVDILIEFPMNQETAAIVAEDFVQDYLKERINAAFVAAGTDLSFGRNGLGNAELLCQKGEELSLEVKIIDKVCVEGEEVSSTLVRDKVELGATGDWDKFLGMPYLIRGTVIHGNRIGRRIGFPTVNVSPDADKLLPPNGVYRSEVVYSGRKFHSISNIGCKPTVTEDKVMGIETYLYDFEEDIYGETIEIYLKDFMRPEQKFESLEALKEQLRVDIEAGRVLPNEKN